MYNLWSKWQKDTSNKVDTIAKVNTIEKSTLETQVATVEQQEMGQIDFYAPTTQDQGASQVIMVEQDKSEET